VVAGIAVIYDCPCFFRFMRVSPPPYDGHYGCHRQSWCSSSVSSSPSSPVSH